MTKKEMILVFGAHSDDFVIGAGGTIAKYGLEGKKVISIVFSYGEKSHPWLKETVIQKTRSKEAVEASKILKCKTIFFNLRDSHFLEDYKKKNLEKVLLALIKDKNPAKIFVHSNEDPHPDHQASHKITLELIEKANLNPEVYIYSIWNPVSFKRKYPTLYVDISKTFSFKLKALKTFRSQRIHIIYPFILLVFRAIKEGLKIRKKFAEKFYRIK